MGRTWPVAVVALLAAACSEPSAGLSGPSAAPSRGDARPSTARPSDPGATGGAPTERARPERTERDRAAPEAGGSRSPGRPEPLRSYLTVPVLGLESFPVVRYRGTPDDGPGTVIQNSGPTASPRGPGGGVGPGVVGNFIITGHRTSHSAPFAELPALTRGDQVRVRSGSSVFVYEVTDTRSTSFRSRVSLARQSAPVPGRPGVRPTEAMITLSTCATPEDHAAGNFWADEFGNPEHRIDKIGVLVDTRPAR